MAHLKLHQLGRISSYDRDWSLAHSSCRDIRMKSAEFVRPFPSHQASSSLPFHLYCLWLVHDIASSSSSTSLPSLAGPKTFINLSSAANSLRHRLWLDQETRSNSRTSLSSAFLPTLLLASMQFSPAFVAAAVACMIGIPASMQMPISSASTGLDSRGSLMKRDYKEETSSPLLLQKRSPYMKTINRDGTVNVQKVKDYSAHADTDDLVPIHKKEKWGRRKEAVSSPWREMAQDEVRLYRIKDREIYQNFNKPNTRAPHIAAWEKLANSKIKNPKMDEHGNMTLGPVDEGSSGVQRRPQPPLPAPEMGNWLNLGPPGQH